MSRLDVVIHSPRLYLDRVRDPRADASAARPLRV
jgi:hypothetical protein